MENLKCILCIDRLIFNSLSKDDVKELSEFFSKNDISFEYDSKKKDLIVTYESSILYEILTMLTGHFRISIF